jgi:hypothetical protein
MRECDLALMKQLFETRSLRGYPPMVFQSRDRAEFSLLALLGDGVHDALPGSTQLLIPRRQTRTRTSITLCCRRGPNQLATMFGK